MNFFGIFKFLSENKSKIFNKNTFYFVIIAGLVLYILLIKGCEGRRKEKEIEGLTKEILKLDKTVQETNGSYRKLVDNFNSEKDLRKIIEDSNKDLAKQLKKNDEKLLMVTKAVATFENKLDKGITVTVGNENGEKVLSFVTRYPDNNPGADWFIEYNGKLYTQSNKMEGEWKFNKLKFNMILTEKPDGMWAYRIDGPDYLKVDSIVVNAQPKDKFNNANNKKISLVLGAGYQTLINLKNPAVSLYGGAEIKQKNIVLFNASTNEYIGVTFLRKF